LQDIFHQPHESGWRIFQTKGHDQPFKKEVIDLGNQVPVYDCDFIQSPKLYANLEKCSFGMEKVHYLGYVIYQHGVHVDPTKIQVIRDNPAPKTLTELQSFLGLANFYHRFVLGFSHIAWALSQINRGGGKEKFAWGWFQQQAFDDLKQCLFLALVLSLPNL
jgi:hypothetical protein